MRPGGCFRGSRGFPFKRFQPDSLSKLCYCRAISPVPVDEEETTSIRELVEQIDAHIEPDEMEAASIPNAYQLGGDLHFPVAD